jgi:aldehyde:ferredoxin oxidoreductase
MLKGYAGSILRVNLTNGRIATEPVTEEMALRYLGGRGFAAAILYEELKPGIDPLGPENKFMLATGPLAGSLIAGGTRHITACKSPLSGGWGEANAAGRFGPMMKAAGFDAIIVEGRAPKPVYLYVHDGGAEIRDASEIWGKFVGDARDAILAQTNPQAEAAVIGPAGENMSLFGCVLTENNRAAGRSGTGAVMGSKNLKGVAVHGTRRPVFHDPVKLAEIRKQVVELCREHPACKAFHENGTPGGIGPHNALGMYPAFNFREGVSDEIAKVEGPTMTRTILTGRQACHGCPVACRRVVEIKEGPYLVDPRYGGPEFETIGALGTCCGIYDLAAIAKGNELCNKYGVDTINAGLSIAWAMECFERGIFTEKDTGGLKLTWGNVEAMLTLIEQISLKKGLGALLARGLKAASAEVGQGSEHFAMQVKNMAFPTHEPRGKVGQGLSFATSNRGACHTQGMHDTNLEAGKTSPEIGFTAKFKVSRMSKELKGEAEALAQNLRGWQDSLIMCRFTCWDYGPTTPAMLAEAFTAITGLPMTEQELMVVGERIFNVCRLFNVREGFSRKDDTLPGRMGDHLPRGATSESTITQEDLDRMLDEYYAFRGWSKDGIPTEERLRQLGISR